MSRVESLSGKIGVLGDVHCEDLALKAARALFAKHDAIRVLAVGDLVDGPGDPHRTLELLADAEAVSGNHDRWYRQGMLRKLPDALPEGTLSAGHRRRLLALPSSREYATAHGRLLLCHGLGEDDMASVRPDDMDYALESNTALQRLLQLGGYRFVVSGHSHRRMVRRIAKTTFINAGTLLRGFEPCVLIVDLDAMTATFFDWDGVKFSERPAAGIP